MTILAFIELRDGAIKKASLEALRAASTLAGESGGSAVALAVGPAATDLSMLGGYGAARVLHVADPRFTAYATAAWATAVAAVASSVAADAVMLGATALGKDLAPQLAVRLEAGLAGDVCLRVETDPDKCVEKVDLSRYGPESPPTTDTTLKLQRCSVCGEFMPVTEKFLHVVHDRTIDNLKPETAKVIEKDMEKYLTACITCRQKYSLIWGTHPRKWVK
jgi:hypothetical protein